MISFAAHVPHSPLLFRSVSGDRIGAVKKTLEALHDIAGEIYARRIETIVLISDHPTMYGDAFSINMADPYHCDLRDVGDLGYKSTYHPDFALVDRLQREARNIGEPLTLTTDDRLNFAAAVPLHFLTELKKDVRVIPIAPSQLSPKEHFTFGQSLKHTIAASEKRIAVISAGDLAHTLTDFAPGGFHEDGEKYDRLMQDLINERNSVGLLTVDERLLSHAQESAYNKLLILYGVLDGMAVSPEITSYEAPFGVGLLTAEFHLD